MGMPSRDLCNSIKKENSIDKKLLGKLNLLKFPMK